MGNLLYLEVAMAQHHQSVAVYDGVQSVCHCQHGARPELFTNGVLDQRISSDKN